MALLDEAIDLERQVLHLYTDQQDPNYARSTVSRGIGCFNPSDELKSRVTSSTGEMEAPDLGTLRQVILTRRY
jgi:hypothetical protein